MFTDKGIFGSKFALIGLLTFVILLNALLLLQNRSLRSLVVTDHSRLDLLKKSDRVEPFTAPLAKGGSIRVDYESEPGRYWVFLYFDPRCRFSFTQLPYWKHFLDLHRTPEMNVIGLVPESVEERDLDPFLRRFGLEGLRTARVPESLREDYKFAVSPSTLVVDSAGRVRQSWPGLWGSQELERSAHLLTD